MLFQFFANSRRQIFTRWFSSTSFLTSSLFDFKNLKFNSVLIKFSSIEQNYLEDAIIEKEITRVVSELKQNGKNAVHVHIQVPLSRFIPCFAKLGFELHHAKPDRIVLVKWLLDHVENKIPPYGTHVVGVGGCVINEKQEILSVKLQNMAIERWTIPGGLVHVNEDISAGVTREVFEETGIRTEFQSVLSFRHTPHSAFDRSDLYFICKLNPRSFDITIDPFEIKEAKWVPLEEFKQSNRSPMILPIIELLEKGYEGLIETEIQSITSQLVKYHRPKMDFN